MKRQWTYLLAAAAAIAVTCVGCAGKGRQPSANKPADLDAPAKWHASDPGLIQRDVMNFADRFAASVADACDELAERATSPAAKNVARDRKIGTVTAAYTNAVEFSPIAGLIDMIVGVTLVRQSCEDPWFTEMFGADTAAPVVAMLKAQERDIWEIGGRYMTEGQCAELREEIARWRREHSGQRYVGWVRLRDFPRAAEFAASDHLRLKGRSSVFALLFLDPFAGLDPTMQEVERSRATAERIFYYAKRLPLLLSWQAESTFRHSLDVPEIAKFTENSTKLGNAAKALADSAHLLPQQVREERERAVKDVAKRAAEERSAAVRQASQAVATERDAALRQAGDVIAAQRDAAVRQVRDAVAAERTAFLDQLNALLRSQREGLLHDSEAASDRVAAHVFRLACTWVALATLLVALAVKVLRRTRERTTWPPAPPRERKEVTTN